MRYASGKLRGSNPYKLKSKESIEAGAGTQVTLDSNDRGLCREILFHFVRNMESMQSY